MQEITLVYPHQLFREHPALKTCKHFYVIEDPLFFSQYSFHKHKLILHRASMKMYEAYLTKKGKKVTYVPAAKLQRSSDIFRQIGKAKEVSFVEVDDDWLEKRLTKAAENKSVTLHKLPTPAFLTPLKTSREYFLEKKKYFMGSFYQDQRKRLNILVEGDKPYGGKWSFDNENRKKLPKGLEIPHLPKVRASKYLHEAKEYVGKHFSENPGDTESFVYPVTFSQADAWLKNFLENRFRSYGDYQDAITKDETFLFHSIISPSLNTGVLTPDRVISAAIDYAEHADIPLNSLEGFIRQVIGWREYVRAVYDIIGSKERTTNFWKHKRKIPPSFWTATTNIEPIDTVIRRVLDTGYCHHIERLMILGNFMLLCEFDPDDVYRWFMELFIDSYDWVMVPNVYGMSQYADGGMIVTKPYISSSNYVRKMSDFKPGNWCDTWDGLYWRFVHKHREFFQKNPRSGMMVRQLDKMEAKKLKKHLSSAEDFISTLN